MKKKKGYITIFLLLLGFVVIAKSKKSRGSVFVDQPLNVNAYSKVGSTVYDNDLSTPIYTFRDSFKVFVIDEDKILENTKITFTANNQVKTGWIVSNNIIYK